MRHIEDPLPCRVGMHRRHEAALDPEGIVEHLRHGRDAVGCAGRVRDDQVAIGVVGGVVDAQHERHVRILAHRRDDNCPGSRVEVRLRLAALREASRRLDDHIDLELTPGEPLGLGNREGPQTEIPYGDRPVADCDLLRQRPQDRVEPEKVSHRSRITEIVDGDDLVVGPALEVGTQEVAPDPSEAVDGYTLHLRAASGDLRTCRLGSTRAGTTRPRATGRIEERCAAS